jgi:hypothetical protein
MQAVRNTSTPMTGRAEAICRRRKPGRYHWGALGVANAVHVLPVVSHTTRLAHLRGQIGVPRRACENHTSGGTLTLSWGIT